MQIVVAKSLSRCFRVEKKRPVRCIDTGIVYASSRDAAEILANEGLLLTPEAIATVCRGKQRSAGGFRWEYVT
jgi:hypothetical protein